MLQIGNPTAINLPVAVQKGKVGMDVTTGQQLGLRPGVIHGHARVSEGPATHVPCLLHLSSLFHSSRPRAPGCYIATSCHQRLASSCICLCNPSGPSTFSTTLEALWGFKVSGCPCSSLPLCHHQGVTETSGLPGVTGAQQQPPRPSLGLLLPLFKVTSGQLLEGFKLSSVGAQSKEEMSSINPARGYGADGTLALGPSCS